MKYVTLLLLATTLIAASCEKDNEERNELLTQDADYLVIGKYFGHCQGNCTHLFKLQNNQIFKDTMQRFTGWEELAFAAKPLPNEQYRTAKVLLDDFPQALFNVTEETVGCPDCADQGGFAIEWSKDGQVRRWRIDTRREDLPDYLKVYVDKVDAVIERLE